MEFNITFYPLFQEQFSEAVDTFKLTNFLAENTAGIIRINYSMHDQLGFI